MKKLIFIIIIFLVGCNSDDTQEATSNNLIVTSSHGIDGSAYGLTDCGSCHAINIIHQGLNIHDIVAEKGFDSCMGCHGDNGTGEARQCKICHNSTDFSHWQTGQFSHNFKADTTLTDTDCVVCHYSSDMNGEFVPKIDLTIFPTANGNFTPYNNISEFCLRCHNRDNPQLGFEMTEQAYEHPLIAMEDNYRFIDKHGWIDGIGERTYNGLRQYYQYKTLVDCTDCHAMHGTNNLNLLIDNSSKGATKLELTQHDVIVKEGNYAQLCVLCHQMTTILEEGKQDAGNGLSGVHEITGDCGICHSHGEAVQAGL